MLLSQTKKNLISIVLLIFTVVLFVYLNETIIKNKQKKSLVNKLQVTTSFYPLYFFASQIGGDKVDVTNLVPSGSEPHDYELSTQDLKRIANSNILIINGNHFEPWGDKIETNLKDNKNLKIVSVSDSLVVLQMEDDGNKFKDPHVWLDPILVKKEAAIISNIFEESDRLNADYYKRNAKVLFDKLDILHNDFQKGLQNCRQNNIVTSHAAFGYLALRYNLKQISISGLSPDEEPTPKKLAEISEFAKNNKIKYIFFESLVSPRLAETIAKEIGAKTIVFNPLEGLTKDEIASGKDYFSIQRQNLDNLRLSLECE